jgi:NAD-dependent dihydropyrimidine dehydrogenase PreA subunit
MIYIDDERCTGCGACVEACPSGAIRLTEGETGIHAEIDEERCQECEACVEACPEEAIMSEVKPTIEGEWVQVKAAPVPVELQPREVRLVRPAPKALTWLGAALAFAGREILPRVAASLLDAWDRRAGRPTPAWSDSISVRPARGTAANPTAGGGRRHRWRRHQGGP